MYPNHCSPTAQTCLIKSLTSSRICPSHQNARQRPSRSPLLRRRKAPRTHPGSVFPQLMIPLFKPTESPETLSRDSRAPRESIVLTCDNRQAPQKSVDQPGTRDLSCSTVVHLEEGMLTPKFALGRHHTSIPPRLPRREGGCHTQVQCG